MDYFFPSILPSINIENQSKKLSYTVNSGENAIRLLLQNLQLKKRSKIALPLFVCDSLKNAVIQEGFEPFYLDLKSDNTFWADYDTDKIRSSNISAVILVHLYGFLHPDSSEIMDVCKNSKIPLIHDAAQSYGIDEKNLTYSSGIVYSFGPGKSSTAAGGAIVKGLNAHFYSKQVKSASDLSIQNFKAELFLKSRVVGYSFTIMDRIKNLILSKLQTSKEIRMMSPYQQKAALMTINYLERFQNKRIDNYNCLKNALIDHPYLKLGYHSNNGLYFKIIIFAKNSPDELKKYLQNNQIPYFSLRDSLFIGKEEFSNYPLFSENSSKFFEFSTEASLNFEEIQRVAEKLKSYRPL